MRAASGARVRGLDTLVRLQRRLNAPRTPHRLPVPDGMSAPLGCDAVAVPPMLGQRVLPRLPRVGCVYADEAHWWWIVPSDSDYAMEWPAPAQYAAGAVLPDLLDVPGLLYRPDGEVPYTPPIPLYLAVCRLTGTTPSWSRPVSA
ncbi:hypothetical protein J7I94_14740 [Streptomyces sp. ISL-12]|uniref:hypothetical protein n=1 Tax=Streptomyces sp. ISL-12 TaxID=2819177 RepID=UPI001BE9E99A|nr:hypothetical protein [Streptomyces sp. ISL-12]MBT2411810.1 hypothetical protein [Streptomyces sp. ISL-12]